MSLQHLTLPDLMAMLPDLHPRHLIDSSVTNIRVLRLVCREVKGLAATAITSWEVALGGAVPLESGPMALLVEGTKLRQLRVSVHVTSGGAQHV